MKWTILAVTVLTIACSSNYAPPSVYPAPRPLTLPDSVGAVWPALVDVVTEWQLPLKTVDRASGLLQTELARSYDEALWDCGSHQAVVGGNYQRRPVLQTEGAYVVLTISAVPRGPETQLRVSADPRVSSVSGRPCASRGTYERDLLEAIRQRWQDLAGDTATG